MQAARRLLLTEWLCATLTHCHRVNEWGLDGRDGTRMSQMRLRDRHVQNTALLLLLKCHMNAAGSASEMSEQHI